VGVLCVFGRKMYSQKVFYSKELVGKKNDGKEYPKLMVIIGCF